MSNLTDLKIIIIFFKFTFAAVYYLFFAHFHTWSIDYIAPTDYTECQPLKTKKNKKLTYILFYTYKSLKRIYIFFLQKEIWSISRIIVNCILLVDYVMEQYFS